LRYLARIQNSSVCPYGLDLRFSAMSKMVGKFRPDGIVFSTNRSCKVYSLMQMDLQKMIGDKYGIPTVMVDVDHADERKYSESKFFLAMETLIDVIESRRGDIIL